MWTDDPDVVESCDFYRSLLNFDSIDSIGAYAATNTIVYLKAPNNMFLMVFFLFKFFTTYKVLFHLFPRYGASFHSIYCEIKS